MKAILVTGATGFLGKHLVEQLKRNEDGVRLRILCRGASPWDQDRRVEVIRGDVTRANDALRAVEGVQEIYHLAGIVSRDPQDKHQVYQTHIEGTRNVCEAARKHLAQKLVVVSSSGTIAVSRVPDVHNESSGYKHEVVGEWPYYLSKIFAEKLAFHYFERFEIPIVVVNPSLLLGPGDDRNSSTRDIALFLQEQILAIPRGGLNFVDARDVARGLIAAMRSGKAGERYLLGGQNWSFREFVENVSRVSGVLAPKLQPSLGAALLSARLLRRFLPWIGKSFDLDDASIRMSSLFWYCDSSKARAELGFETRDPIETLRDTVADVRRRVQRTRVAQR